MRCKIMNSEGTPYVEALFTDVTELYEKRQDLRRQDREMKEIYSLIILFTVWYLPHIMPQLLIPCKIVHTLRNCGADKVKY